MRKTIVMLAVVVGLAGLQMDAEARGGKGGGGKGGGSQGMGVGEMTGAQEREQNKEENGEQDTVQNKEQNRERNRLHLQDGSRAGAATKTRDRLQVRDPESHTTAPVGTPEVAAPAAE